MNRYFAAIVDNKTKLRTTPKSSVPGKFYGLAKEHKKNYQLRPVNSMIGTPEFELAKLVDSTIKPFIPSKFMVKSSYVDDVFAVFKCEEHIDKFLDGAIEVILITKLNPSLNIHVGKYRGQSFLLNVFRCRF